MPAQTDQRPLLDALSRMGSAGRAEGEDAARFPRTYHPIAEHVRAFDPDVVLVVGPRGAGKTELFRAVLEMGLLSKIAPRVASVRLPSLDPKKTSWIAGYPIGTGFPDHLGLREFVLKEKPTDETFLEVWFAYLARILRAEIQDTLDLQPIQGPPGADIASILWGFRRSGQAVLVALDSLDERLEKQGRHIFVAYDELDTLGRGDWAIIHQAVRGLVGFWATRSRRWKRIRAKVFLRTDLYDRSGSAGGADFAKLAANRVELSWSDENLYTMLVKRIANTDNCLLEYCKKKLAFDDESGLGWIPRVERSTDVRPLVERIVGSYMGAGERKGLSFRWLLDHVRDGRGQALPRPLVRLVEAAADIQKKSPSHPRWPRLLEPKALRRALDSVSAEHVTQAIHEWPWLVGLKKRLAEEREVPWDRRQIERALGKEWDQPWGEEGSAQLPAENPRELVDYLVEVGVFRMRADSRIDVPDLYLSGLGLKRRGGVTKK